jgi:hypothetical protein
MDRPVIQFTQPSSTSIQTISSRPTASTSDANHLPQPDASTSLHLETDFLKEAVTSSSSSSSTSDSEADESSSSSNHSAPSPFTSRPPAHPSLPSSIHPSPMPPASTLAAHDRDRVSFSAASPFARSRRPSPSTHRPVIPKSWGKATTSSSTYPAAMTNVVNNNSTIDSDEEDVLGGDYGDPYGVNTLILASNSANTNSNRTRAASRTRESETGRGSGGAGGGTARPSPVLSAVSNDGERRFSTSTIVGAMRLSGPSGAGAVVGGGANEDGSRLSGEREPFRSGLKDEGLIWASFVQLHAKKVELVGKWIARYLDEVRQPFFSSVLFLLSSYSV